MMVGIVVVAGLATGIWYLRDHVAFLLRFEGLGKNAWGLKEYRHRRTGIVMVRIPGGTFLMGSPDRVDGVRTSESPQHEVTLSPFLISKYEVTQSEWSNLRGNPSPNKGNDIPVHGVSGLESQEFCRKVGLSLPTDAAMPIGSVGFRVAHVAPP